MTTLLLSSRYTEDNQQLWRAAVQRGWNVERSHGLTIPEFHDDKILLYIEALFAPSIAIRLGLRLVEVPLNWLPTLPPEYRHREIGLTTLGNAHQIRFPAFVKPPNDKSFAAQVYYSPLSLPTEYDATMPVLVATPVEWEVEFRCFCLNGVVKTLSPYLRQGQLSQLKDYASTAEELNDAKQFAEEVLDDERVYTLSAVALDVGVIKGVGWAVVEANAAWGSGIYGRDPDRVLDVIQYAVEKESAHI